MPTTSRSYVEPTSRRGSWTCPVQLPPTPIPRVREALTALAEDTGWPVAAFLFGDADDPVTELLLYRDPSRRFGVPSIPDSEAAARALAAGTGWVLVSDRAPGDGILVGLGLREGYAPDAFQHRLDELTTRLAGHRDGWACRPARLVSVRTAAPWYDEQGAVVRGSSSLRSAISAAARDFGQVRFVVTDLDQDRVYALAR